MRLDRRTQICLLAMMPNCPPFAPDRRAVLAGLAASVLILPARANDLPSVVRAGPVKRQILPEPAGATPGFGLNGETGTFLLRAPLGKPFSTRLENGLEQPFSLHPYGLHGANAVDGVAGLTQPPIASGTGFDLSFTPTHVGLHWLQPLARGTAAAQFAQGLTGVLIVDEPTPLPADRDIVVVIKDWRLREDGSSADLALDAADVSRAGRLGNRMTINGRPEAETLVLPPRSRVRVRVLNAANARIMPMRVDGAVSATVIALDGQPTEPFDPLRKQVILAPGGRFELMVEMPGETGAECALQVALGNGLPVLRLRSEGAAVEARRPVPALPGNPLPEAIMLQKAERATLEISGGLPAPAAGSPPVVPEALRAQFPDASRVWQINGGRNQGFAGPPLLKVKSGAPCVVALVNRSAWTQVLHVHGHHLRYLHPYDDGWEPFWLDTVLLAPGQTIRVAFAAEAPGKWAIRSSILEHFEGGVVTWFEVT